MEELLCGSFSADVEETQCQGNYDLARQRCSARASMIGFQLVEF